MKRVSAVIGFAYLIGLLCAFTIAGSPIFGLITFTICIIAGLLFLLHKKANIGVFIIIFGAAFGIYSFYRAYSIDSAYRLDGETRDVSGVVISKSKPSHDSAAFIIEAVIDGTKIKFSMFSPDSGAEIGDKITFEARFSLLQNNTAFHEASYFMGQGIFLRATPLNTLVVEKRENISPLGLIRSYNEYIKRKIITAFPNDTGALICAVFLGDRSMLSPELSRNITRAGIAHYAAVSGLHLTLIAHLFMSVFNISGLRTKRKIKFVFLSFFTLIFMVFFNLSPSVTRAGIMLIVFYSSELFMRKRETLNSIGFAALIILLISPYAALDAGLLMSIAGTIGIGVFAPVLNKQFTVQRFKHLHHAFIANICAICATFPLVSVFFGGVSLATIITSVILLPLFMVMLTAMAVFAITAGFDGLSLLISGLTSRLMEIIITFFGNIKFVFITLDYTFMLPWIIASIIFIVLIWFYYRKVKLCIKTTAFAVFVLAMMIVFTEYSELNKTRLGIYTNGSAASVFIHNNNTSVVIITDAHTRTANAAIDFMKNNFLDEISLLVVLNNTNNALPLFEEIPALAFIPPNSYETFDVSGIFTVTVDNNQAFINYNDIDISIAHIRISKNADINITYNYSVHAGDFKGLVIHTSRRAEAENTNELNAYYERVGLVLSSCGNSFANE
jgi:competence protein ComEC